MKREHKYKAWDKTNKEWFMEGKVFDLDFSGSYGEFFFDNDNPCNMRNVELEWVPYAGLNDKNGVMLFDGHVYKNKGETYLIERVNPWDGFRWHKIYDKWLDKNVFERNKRSWLNPYDAKSGYEIIGHIKESPDLTSSKIL